MQHEHFVPKDNMCKILTIINKNPHNAALLNKFIQANEDALAGEKDGYALYQYHRGVSQRKTFVGEEAYKNIAANIKYVGAELYMVHFRTKTSGGVGGVEGLHLDKIQNRFVYAHNGTVYKYAKEKTKSDSYHFFVNLLSKELTTPSIEEAIDESFFWGRGFLFDETENRLHVFCNYDVYIYGLPDCLILTSYPLVKTLPSYSSREVLGFPFFVENKNTELPVIGEDTITHSHLVFENGIFIKDEILRDRRSFDKKKIINLKGKYWNTKTKRFEDSPLPF